MQTRETPNAPRALAAVVLAVTLAVMLVGAVIGVLVRPGYTSTAQLYVAGSPVSGRVASYAALAEGPVVATRVDRQLALEGSPEDLQGRIHSDITSGTRLLEVRVTASSAAQAQRTAVAVVQQLRAVARSIDSDQGDANAIRVVSAPTAPTERDGSNVLHYALAGLPIGLVLGLLAALALGLRPRPVREGGDVTGAIDAPVLCETTLPPVGLLDTDTGTDPAEGIDDLRDSVRFLGVDHHHGPVVLVTTPGDDGADVEAAIQLARSLARSESRVLLVDADLRTGALASRLGLPGTTGLSDVVAGDAELREAVQTEPDTGLSVLASGPLPAQPGRAERLGGSAGTPRRRPRGLPHRWSSPGRPWAAPTTPHGSPRWRTAPCSSYAVTRCRSGR